MKIFKILSLIITAGILFSFTVFNFDEMPSIEGDIITWKGEKLAGSHEGTIALKSGALEYDKKGKLTGGEFIIDMTSIKNTDMKGKMSDNLVGHLNSTEFFNVAKFPTASLKIKNVEALKKGDYKVTADLTIKGITNELSFNATVNKKEEKKIATAKIMVDRTLYDIKYGSGKFFEDLGDKLIKDEFEMNVTLTSK